MVQDSPLELVQLGRRLQPELVEHIQGLLEHLQRIGIGTPDVMATVAALEKRGVEFLSSDTVRSTERGALTKPYLGSVMFELVHSERADLPPVA